MLQDVLDADRRPGPRGGRDRGPPGQRARRERRAARGHRVRGRASRSTTVSRHRHRHRPRFRPARGAPRRAAAPVRPGRDPRPRAGPRRAASPRPGAPATTPTVGTRSGSRSRARPPNPSPPRRRRPTRPPRAGQPRAGPAAAARARRASRTGSSPSSWSRSSCGACGTCSTCTPWPWSSTRATARAPPRSRAPDPRAGRSSSTSRCPSHRRCAARSGCSARPSDRDGGEDLVELVAYRVAMAVETRWLRAVDQRRRAWMAYLAEASELLGQSLSVELAVAVVPQVVVPRLGRWCAVHLSDAGTLRLAALTHADEDELPELRAALDPDARPGPVPGAARPARPAAAPEAAPVRIAAPTDGLAVSLRSRGTTIGTLLVGRPDGRPHAPEDVVLIADIARRAALAVQNAQSAAAHVAVSQALQQALLPRALPAAAGIDLAAEYLPASRGIRRRRRLLRRPHRRRRALPGLDRRRLRQGRPRRGPHRPRPRRPARAGARRARARRRGAPAQRGDDGGRRPAAVLHARRRARPRTRRRASRRASRSSCCSRATSGRCWSGRTGGPSRSGRSARRSACCRRCWSRSPRHRLGPATRCCSTPTASPNAGAARSSSGRNGCSRSRRARPGGPPARSSRPSATPSSGSRRIPRPTTSRCWRCARSRSDSSASAASRRVRSRTCAGTCDGACWATPVRPAAAQQEGARPVRPTQAPDRPAPVADRRARGVLPARGHPDHDRAHARPRRRRVRAGHHRGRAAGAARPGRAGPAGAGRQHRARPASAHGVGAAAAPAHDGPGAAQRRGRRRVRRRPRPRGPRRGRHRDRRRLRRLVPLGGRGPAGVHAGRGARGGRDPQPRRAAPASRTTGSRRLPTSGGAACGPPGG